MRPGAGCQRLIALDGHEVGVGDYLDRTVKFAPIMEDGRRWPRRPRSTSSRDEATAFLDANAARKEDDDKPFVWGEGADDVSLFEEVDRQQGDFQDLAESQGLEGEALRRRARLDRGAEALRRS